MSQQPKRFTHWNTVAAGFSDYWPLVKEHDELVDEIAMVKRYLDVATVTGNKRINELKAVIAMHEWIGERIYRQIPEVSVWDISHIRMMVQFLLTLYPPVVCRVEFAKDLMQGLAEKSGEIARLTTELAKRHSWSYEKQAALEKENERLAGIIKNIQERNSEMKYQIAFNNWKLGELHCPTCESTDLSPPNQYCTKQYVCKKCSLQFDPVKEHENVELPGLETKDASPPAATDENERVPYDGFGR